MNSKRRLTQMLSFISATLGIVCIACFFFPFLSVTSENGSESFYTGIEVALGYSDSIIKMGMNILLVVTFALLILTAIITLVKYKSKIANLITILLYIATVLLVFLLPIYAKSMGNMMIGNNYEFGLAWGSAFSGIIALIAVVLNITTLILNKKLDNEPEFFEEQEQETAVDTQPKETTEAPAETDNTNNDKPVA